MPDKIDISDLTQEEAEKLNTLVDPDAPVQDRYKFGEEFQREILSILLTDRQFLIESKPLIKPIYFVNEAHRNICGILFDYFAKYSSMPNRQALVHELRTKLTSLKKPDEIQDHQVDELNVVLKYIKPGVECRDYYRDKITNFAKIQALKVAVHTVFEKMKDDPESDETWSSIHQTLRDALTVEHHFDMGSSYFENYEQRYDNTLKNIKAGEIFTTGFPSIDKAFLMGGLTRGEMAAWVGLSGTGKSCNLVTAALANLHLGKKVLYISLEMNLDRVSERFDVQFANLSATADKIDTQNRGVTMTNFFEKKEIIFEALKDYGEFLGEDKRRMIIKQFPGGEMGVDEFAAYYSQIVLHGFKPDLIILDYIGEMKDYPGIPTHESRYRIVRDLRGMAVREQFCLITALQANRSAKTALRTVGMFDDESLGDSYAQMKPLDAMWMIQQEQMERECSLARVYVAKHRVGKSRYIFYVKIDYDTLMVQEISEVQYNEELKKYKNVREKTTTDKLRDEITKRDAEQIINKKSYRDDIGNQEPEEPEPGMPENLQGA